jgi:hypothetical protein
MIGTRISKMGIALEIRELSILKKLSYTINTHFESEKFNITLPKLDIFIAGDSGEAKQSKAK